MRYLPDPVPDLKAEVAGAIVSQFEGWSLEMAGATIGTNHARMSNLRNGRLEPFSLERLIRFLWRAHGVVTLQITFPRRRWYVEKKHSL